MKYIYCVVVFVIYFEKCYYGNKYIYMFVFVVWLLCICVGEESSLEGFFCGNNDLGGGILKYWMGLFGLFFKIVNLFD